MKKYYSGNYYNDFEKEYKEHWGWLVGEFMRGFRKRKDVEIKFWKYKKGQDPKHKKKIQRRNVECAFILRGEIKGEIDDKKVVLRKGDYVVIPSQVSNDFPQEILEDVEGLTIKAPSASEDKITKNL